MNANLENIKEIAETLEAIVEERAWVCPDCGEVTYGDYCTNWRCEDPEGEIQQATMYDWVELNTLDADYRVWLSNGELVLRGARYWVTLGGPNIYVDTDERLIHLYWGTDHESYPISSDVCDELHWVAYEYIRAFNKQ